VILAGGALLRAWYLQELVQQPDFERPFLDPKFYDFWARALVTGDWTPPFGEQNPETLTTPFTRPPGYPYFLAAVYWLTGMSYLGARIAQMSLGLVNAVLMFFLGRALFGRSVGLVAAAFMATYWIFIYFEGDLNAPVLIIFLLLSAVNVLRLWPARITIPRGAMVGLFMGLLALIRPETLPFLAVILAWGVWATWRQQPRWRVWAGLAMFVLGCVVAIAPVTVRNYRVGREFVLICSAGGVNLYAGNNELADGIWPSVDFREPLGLAQGIGVFSMPEALRALQKKLGRDDITHSDFSRYFVRLGLDYIKAHPIRTLKLIGKKAILFWGPSEIANDKELELVKAESMALRYLPGFPAALAGFLLGLGLMAGRARNHWRDRRVWPDYAAPVALVLLYIAAQFASVLPFFVPGRYRVSIIPFLLLLGAYAVCQIVACAWGRHFVKAGLGAGGAVALYALCHVEPVPYEPHLGRWHYFRGSAYMNKGELGRAESEFRRAVDSGRAPLHCFIDLGALASMEGDAEDAIAWFEHALEVYPHSAAAHAGIGYELARLGRRDEAMAHFRKAIEANYQFTPAYHFIGNVLMDTGQYEEAIDWFSKAREANPTDPYPNLDYSWGRALALQGKLDEAIVYFREAIRRNPNNADAHSDLGFTLEKLGRGEEALAQYWAAIEIDPRHVPARANLGKALESQGKLTEALEQFRTVMQIVPGPAQEQNVRRVEQKLKAGGGVPAIR